MTYYFFVLLQLAHDVSLIKGAFIMFIKLRWSLRDEVVTTKAQVKALEELRKASRAREAKLEKELESPKMLFKNWKPE